jgi:hypothetical protein
MIKQVLNEGRQILIENKGVSTKLNQDYIQQTMSKKINKFKSHVNSHVVDPLNSFTAIDGCDHQIFDKLLCKLVTSPIFVHF